jgi:glycerophosphoryl diester phosphodiesterase
MEENILVGSFIDNVINTFRDECPEIATSANMTETKLFYGLNLFHISWLYHPPFDVIEIPPVYKKSFILDSQFIMALHQKNIPIYVWTINDTSEMKRLIHLGADGIITDYPNRLQNILKNIN